MADKPKKKSKQIVVKTRRKKNPVPADERAYLGMTSLKILKLREAGFSWPEVAKEIGTTVAKARGVLTSFLKTITQSTVESWETVRRIEHAELATMELMLWKAMELTGDPAVILKLHTQILKTKEVKYKLLGMNKTEQLEIVHKMPQISLSLPSSIVLNENKLIDKVITVTDSVDILDED